MSPEVILDFWFDEIQPAQWWKKVPAFDQQIRRRFGQWLLAARTGELDHWAVDAWGTLALVIVLDQFSRNIYRDSAEAFAGDARALALASVAVDAGWDQQLNNAQKHFLYMPFMHSESLALHDRALQLFSALEGEDPAAFERRHRDIIERFGRYPHRNEALGRVSTAEELAFLQTPGSRF
ncbi:DUF924 family protein [Simiduia agarivorans]|uniref:Transmembrane protein n=1 Tax=Simiduia agarivorans (strain DSM 21679 / JCM 13881 / BCRC 17597 / SA1) TaxID=1117647 RepID=K4KGK4_SIMAS|nr:DUF924 family protein [Simiduia agarivorans]AFU98121.1 hypothetical protein M5M_04570 [Simiduia agarivorans SA1 = DSM 21679]